MKELANIVIYEVDEEIFKVKVGSDGVVTDSGEQETVLAALEQAFDDHPNAAKLYDYFGWA